MRVLVALDKFKEALPAPAACAAVASALRELHPDWTLDLCPLADGGDGFVSALAGENRDWLRSTRAASPLGDEVEAVWALAPVAALPDALRARLGLGADADALAVIEMATCSGLALVPSDKRDVWSANSRGVGQLISAATKAGADAILVGVGGSATNDLGLGALAALGFRAFDADGHEIADLAPARWRDIARLEAPPAKGRRTPPLWIACDVDNPLCGPRGATFTYGPQKGLAAGDAPRLDAEMKRVAGLLAVATGASPSVFDAPGAGAAGGIAGGLMAALGARLTSGFDLVAEWLDLERRVAAADLVITGEGGFDDTSLQGKGPGGLVRAALARGKRTLVLAGRVQVSTPPAGLELAAITPADMPKAEALPATARLLAETTRRVFP